MFDWALYLEALESMATFGLLGWVLSVFLRNVTIVDSMWAMFFLLGVLCFVTGNETMTERGLLILVLVTAWSARLTGYLTWRNRPMSRGMQHEDHRYAAIRKNNQPFWFKSLYIVFGFQVLLAWIISLPLLGAANSSSPLSWLDGLGLALWLFGFLWESIGDAQLSRFKADPANRGKVMDSGLWRYSRHPNYFGECCLWWGFYLIALSAGAWWSLPAPVLMTLLLLKVSGVALLEKDIGERRPAYAAYIARTNAFIPGLPR
ncbi:DUF1295 domain-containing protein [Pseudomethylobacillus aquaticus]|uniref:DUF1295 domain-containing protein n=1 Tax=Pseudomethylobacillus aquaticus TaxID=2676064 RepID=A0A3N0V6M9_9PROT|nr:DUF1295 domain-containing protein [Pseudomethylobacillus aquaticus]ROH88028.1 DUF1295 domain-containing protein [Pseudomethylobacillus aquaticus]